MSDRLPTLGITQTLNSRVYWGGHSLAFVDQSQLVIHKILRIQFCSTLFQILGCNLYDSPNEEAITEHFINI